MPAADPKTETALADALGCTRAMIAQWRREHIDAPLGRNVEAWKRFLAQHGLGTRAKGSAWSRAVLEAEECLANAEMALGGAEIAIKRANTRKAAAMRAVRDKMVPLFQKTWDILR